MTEDDDAGLVARALKGEQAAYSVLMRRHRDAIYRLARAHVGGDADAALDVVQETFVAAFAALHRYDAARPFRAWLSRIAINKCRDRARRAAVRRFFSFARPLEDGVEAPDAAPDPEASARSGQEVRRIERAVAALPDTLKEVLLLRTIEQLSQADTAQVLGVSEKAVETRLYRARQKLSAMLRDEVEPRV
ncbi:RNA polymerase sigma factor [Sphingomonas adhaesiva]|uniref:RNA polymerase sigma factor n=1 Tax=Sphingomonas adhaesiva TaxID=28212 RepID=UPI002FF623D9